MDKRKILILTIISLTIFLVITLPTIIAPNSPKEQQSVVESIELQTNENQIQWETNGHSAKGFKVVWSRNENPTYPTRTGDKYRYHSDPNKNSDTLEAFDGEGTYYVRVCEYLSGECGRYSNQAQVRFGEEKENTCQDTDGGENYYTKGTVTIISTNETKTDYCKVSENETILIEQSCDLMDNEKETEHTCSNGCVDGACIKLNPTTETGPIETQEPIRCNGCTYNTTCYPIGYRTNGIYCSGNLEFTNQSQEDSFCDNNFECESNICVSGKCLSQGFLQKIISWFKAIF